MALTDKTTHVLGSKLDLLKREEVFYLLEKWLSSEEFHHLVTLNPEIALMAEKYEHYRREVNKAELTVADGIGLIFASLLLSKNKLDRITGTDLLEMVCTHADKQKKNLFLLGGDKGVAKKAAEVLVKNYPGLNIVGYDSGPTKDEFVTHTPKIVKKINGSKADILLVAFGAPKQEKWIIDNRDQLKHVKLAMGLGGVFNYLSGKADVPPVFMRKIGLEWLYRLFKEPWRYKRIYNAVIRFPLRVLNWYLSIYTVYRSNVVALILDEKNRVLVVTPWWSDEERWQFPQGGVDPGESPSTAIFREMKEELGTDKFEILKEVSRAHKYIWPHWYKLLRGYKGQRQDLFILRYKGNEKDFDIESEGEIIGRKWVEVDEVMNELADSRREIGAIALKEYQRL